MASCNKINYIYFIRATLRQTLCIFDCIYLYLIMEMLIHRIPQNSTLLCMSRRKYFSVLSWRMNHMICTCPPLMTYLVVCFYWQKIRLRFTSQVDDNNYYNTDGNNTDNNINGDVDIYTIKSWWRHQMETFSAWLALCEGNSPVTGEFPSQSQWRGALMFSLICAWTNGWAHHRDAGDLRHHRTHYDVTVM